MQHVMKQHILVLEDLLELFKKNSMYMTSISKNVYIDKLHDIVNKYNNSYHSTIKLKLTDVKSNTYINSTK